MGFIDRDRQGDRRLGIRCHAAGASRLAARLHERGSNALKGLGFGEWIINEVGLGADELPAQFEVEAIGDERERFAGRPKGLRITQRPGHERDELFTRPLAGVTDRVAGVIQAGVGETGLGEREGAFEEGLEQRAHRVVVDGCGTHPDVGASEDLEIVAHGIAVHALTWRGDPAVVTTQAREHRPAGEVNLGNLRPRFAESGAKGVGESLRKTDGPRIAPDQGDPEGVASRGCRAGLRRLHDRSPGSTPAKVRLPEATRFRPQVASTWNLANPPNWRSASARKTSVSPGRAGWENLTFTAAR